MVKPPSRIADKVPKRGGPSPEAAITRALGMAEDLIVNYQDWAIDDLQALWQEFQDAVAEKGEASDHIERMFNLTHEIRGQGGTFGYPLVSTVGDSLCKFLENKTALQPLDLEIIRLHILAMRAVFRQKLKGDQKALQGELARLLALVRERNADDEG